MTGGGSIPVIERTIAPLTACVLGHPVVTGLADGSLPEGVFRRFLVQDALFLRDFGRSLALCAARVDGTGDLRLLCGQAADALDVERDLHDRLAADLGIPATEFADARPSPTCEGYGSFLVRTCAIGALGDAVAALAPCYLMFRRVGAALAASGSPDPRYAAWIATYDGEAFGAATDAHAELCGRVLDVLPSAARDSAVAHALTAAGYEWLFWDAAWRDERWPDEEVTRCSRGRTSG